MKTSEQIKGAIRNISKKTGVNPNSLLQMCLFEGILEKLSKSKYSENFILKGGLLISSLIGVDMRSTMDMDTTLRGIPLNEESISNILNEILAIEIDADIEYKLIKLSPIRQEDVYEDFFLCKYILHFWENKCKFKYRYNDRRCYYSKRNELFLFKNLRRRYNTDYDLYHRNYTC